MKETKPAVEHVTQPDTDLCWATCILMMRNVLKEKNKDITVEKIASRCLYKDPTNSNKPGYPPGIKAAIEDWVSGVNNCKYVERPFTWEEVKKAVDENKPVMIRYGWSEGGGHAMVIGGYEVKGKTDKGEEWGFVKLFDPLRKESKDISYDRLLKGDYDLENWPGVEKGHVWTSTWYLL